MACRRSCGCLRSLTEAGEIHRRRQHSTNSVLAAPYEYQTNQAHSQQNTRTNLWQTDGNRSEGDNGCNDERESNKNMFHGNVPFFEQHSHAWLFNMRIAS